MKINEAAREIIKIDHVRKTYMIGEKYFNAIQDMNLQINEGEFVAIVGKSGSGKSTLLNLMSGVDEPTEGSIFVAGKDIKLLSAKELTRFRGKNIGIVFQFFQLIPTLTVLENVMMPMEFVSHLNRKQRVERAKALLDKVGMLEHMYKRPANLSGGEQQRVAIARALANDPQVILADEPTGNLDSVTTEEIFQLLNELSKEGKSIIMVTHNNELSLRCERRICISDGRVIEDVRKEG